jgi:SAM-dependent methyltransferase
VKKLLAVEPNGVARKIAGKAIRKAPFPVEFVGLDGERVDLPDASADTAVSILTLCTIPRADRALKEIARILKPGGSLLFTEHGASSDPGILRWQNRLDGIQGKLFGGCHLNRPIADLIRDAGFKFERLENFYIRGMPNPMGYAYLGVANKADS